MDGEMIIESLDSLWFFSNILSHSPNAPPCPPKIQLISDPVVPPEILVKPVEARKESEEKQMPEPKGFEISQGNHEVTELAQRRKKSKGGQQRRRRCDKFCEEEMSCLVSALLKHQHSYRHGCGAVPAASGGDLAMKEHLKSWAHAVACTVK